MKECRLIIAGPLNNAKGCSSNKVMEKYFTQEIIQDYLNHLKISFPLGVGFCSKIDADFNEEEFLAKFPYVELIKDFGDTRKKEFLLGRKMAHTALSQLISIEEQSVISIQKDRSPQWPNSWVGSLSHSRKNVLAVVGSSQYLHGIGIDLESKGRWKDSHGRKILTDRDLPFDSIQSKGNWSREDFNTLIFSAKESLYKTLYPSVKKFFGFEAAYLSFFDYEKGQFELSLMPESDLLKESIPQSYQGHFIESEEEVLTLIFWQH